MALEVSNVKVRFGGNTVLNDVSLDAPDGAITALIGPNGAGKTTLFNVITGVLNPASGRVGLGSLDLTRMSAHRRVRSGLGRTFQRLELFGTLSVTENLRVAATSLPRGQRQASVDAIIERLGLGSIADIRTDTLPTGTGRLVELGRALLGQPKLLLLDEPASGQDDEETVAFSNLLVELANEGLSVLLVEHDMDLVMRISDRIHVLDFGTLIASGTPTEMRSNAMVQAAYLGEVVAANDGSNS
ncbi:MAG TPA: ATP-binding cassette domain-containing protein [Microthrixaceae bacterium]|nr:ATP-binding cassette domain-containing protein [Microthrixaceae bacterium]